MAEKETDNEIRIQGNSVNYIKVLCDEQLQTYYPAGIPDFARERYLQELSYIEAVNGADALRVYREFVDVAKKNDGLIVSRGRGIGLFVQFLLGDSHIDPLPAYRYCEKCGYSELIDGFAFGIDAPLKECPHCKTEMASRGYSLPGIFVWGNNIEKMPFIYDTTDLDLRCSNGLKEPLYACLQKLYANNQVVWWVSEDTIEDGPMIVNGFWVLPQGKELTKDYPQFVFKNKNLFAKGDMHDVYEQGILAVSLMELDILNKIVYMQKKTGISCSSITDSDVRDYVAGDYLNTSLLTMEQEKAFRALPASSKFLLTEGIASAFNWFENNGCDCLEKDPWSASAYKLNVQDRFFTRETLFEKLRSFGLTEEEAYKVTAFVRKGKANKAANCQKEWEEIIKKYSFTKDFADFCESYRYMFPRGNVVIDLWLLSLCVFYLKRKGKLMIRGPWIGNNLNKHVKVLILGESHYDEASNYGDKVSFSTAGVVDYYFKERKRWAAFFDKMAASFGYDRENARSFYEQVYFANYVDVVCGIQNNNCASYYINKNRRQYNNELFEFINKNDIDVVVCFSKRVYDNLPSLGAETEKCYSEPIGKLGNRINKLGSCFYCHDVEHGFCDVKLKSDLKVYGIRHPSTRGGYSVDDVYKFMREQDDVKHICYVAG